MAQPQRWHARRSSTGRPTSTTSAPSSPPPWPRVPRLRERVVAGVGRFSPPVWRPDPGVRPRPPHPPGGPAGAGHERQLLDLVAAIYQDPYDRTRPLWMFHVIDGLEGGRAALVWKIHHAVADGIGAGRLAESYLQPTREPPDAAGRRPRRDHRRRRRRRRRGARLAVVRRAPCSARSPTPPGARRASPGGRSARWRCGAPTRCAPGTPSDGVARTRRARCAGRSAAGRRPRAAAHRCGASAPATATSRSCRSRWTRRWPRRRASAARSTTGSSPASSTGRSPTTTSAACR